MSKRQLVVAVLVCLVIMPCAGRLLADDAVINATFSSLAPQTFEHDDQPDYKGWALVNVYNDTSEYWTDFHFSIKSVNGSNISATIFIDYAPYQPTSSQTLDSWSINNDPAGASMDLFFASNPVAPDTEAWFKVYTDNTTYKQRFGVCVYPTVPEPSSLLAFCSGLIGLAGMALKKMR